MTETISPDVSELIQTFDLLEKVLTVSVEIDEARNHTEKAVRARELLQETARIKEEVLGFVRNVSQYLEMK